MPTDPSSPPPRHANDANGAEVSVRTRLILISVISMIPLALLLLIAIDPPHLINLGQLQARRHQLQALVRDHPLVSVLLYMSAYFMVTGFSLPGALVMTLTGGFLFGMWEGSAAAVTGATAGATGMFLAARSAWGGALRDRAVKWGGLIERLEAGASRNAFSYILMLRLIPGVPIWIVNVTAGLLRMSTSSYLVATVVGIAPSTIVYSAIGSGLGRMFERGQRPDPTLLLEPQWLATLAGLAALALIPAAWRHRSRLGFGRPLS